MLVLNREGRFHTESAPMESCRPAIIVSFGVTARWGSKRLQRSRNRFRGRVSCLTLYRSSTIRNTSLGPVAQAFLPVFWGWAMTIFNFRQLRHSRSVSNPPQHSRLNRLPTFAPIAFSRTKIGFERNFRPRGALGG